MKKKHFDDKNEGLNDCGLMSAGVLDIERTHVIGKEM